MSLISRDISGIYIAQEGETEQAAERTRSFKAFRNGDRTVRVAGQIGPIHYRENPFDDQEQLKEIDLDILLTPGEDWDAECKTNGYQLRLWQSRQIGGKTLRYIAQFRRAGKWLGMAPITLLWQNDVGERQLISRPVAGIIPAIDNDANTITWTDCFGTGIHFRYNLRPDQFFKTLIIDDKGNLPARTIGLSGLKLTLVMAISWHGQSRAANGFANSVSPDEFPEDYSGDADEEIVDPDTFCYRDELDRDTFWLQRPRAWDSAEEQRNIDLGFRLRRRGNRVFAALSIPADALNHPSVIYPVFMDVAIAEEQVGAGNDDAWKRYDDPPGLFNASGVLMSFGRWISSVGQACFGTIFRSVPIPQGATIDTATLVLHAGSNESGTVVRSRIRAYDGDDYSDNLSTEGKWDAIFPGSLTTAEVDWDSIAAWTSGTWYTSPEIKAVIEEVVMRGGWVSGNDLVLFLDDYDDRSTIVDAPWRKATSYDGSAANAPKFNATYTAAPSPPTGALAGPLMGPLGGPIG